MKITAIYRILDNKEKLFLYSILILLTLISFKFYNANNIYLTPKMAEEGLLLQNMVLTGQIEAHCQYRVFKPIAGMILQKIASVFFNDVNRQYLISYKVLILLTFLGIYYSFSIFLRLFYPIRLSIMGLLLLQVLIPLSFVSYIFWMDIHYYNLLFHSIGLCLIFKKKDFYLPLLFLIGSLNREQFIFLNVFYAIYLISEKKLFTKRGIVILSANTIIFVAVYLGLRYYFGFKQSYSTVEYEISYNTEYWFSILRLWINEVAIFVILCMLVYKKSNKFFKYSFLSLGIYTILFFFNGHMNELAKFLPAYLIMISMCLQLLETKHGKEIAPT